MKKTDKKILCLFQTVSLLLQQSKVIKHNTNLKILRLYGNINIQKAKEYQDVVEQYYPIETIVYGIKNNKQDFIDKGRKEIILRTRKNNKLK